MQHPLQRPLSDAVVLLAFGAIVGACFGAARWLLLRAQGGRLSRWVLASAVGLMIGYPLAAGVLELLPELDQPWVGVAIGACAGTTTALIERLIVRRQIGELASKLAVKVLVVSTEAAGEPPSRQEGE